MIMHKDLRRRGYIDRLFVSRKGVRELTSFKYCVDLSTQKHEDYIKKCIERLITADHKIIGNIITDGRTTKTRKQKSEEKQLYGYFKRQSSDIARK